VNVFDGRSDAVEHLPQDAFTIFEDNTPQRIELFEDLEVPVTVGLVIDNSSSMLSRRAMVRAAVRAFADSAGKNDELFTIVFNEHVRIGNPTGPFTRSRDAIMASLVRYPAGGRTALYDGVIEALAHIEGASNQKRVLVILSDGDDNASGQSRANMLYRATTAASPTSRVPNATS
jgi:VWFA-related protein